MKSNLTGADVRRIRDIVQWATPEFAALLGVNGSTVYRWEMRDTALAPIEPLQAQLLVALDAVLSRADKRAGGVATIRRDLTEALALGGTLRALHTLLAATYALTQRPAPSVVVVLSDEMTGTTPTE